MIHTLTTRRQWLRNTSFGIAALFLANTVSMFMTACGVFGGNVFTSILNWLPIGQRVLDSILTILTANGVLIAAPIQVIIDSVKAGFDALRAAILEYQSTTPAPVGTLQKIETAFKDIVDNFKTFLASLKISGGLLGIIIGIAQVILSTIGAFVNRLPASSSMRRTIVIGDTLRMGEMTVPVVLKSRDKKSFKLDVNAVLDRGVSAGVVIPKSARL